MLSSRVRRALGRVGETGSPGPTRGDLLLSLIILLISAVHWPHPDVARVVVSLALVAALPFRRRRPVAVFAVLWVVAAIGILAVGPVFADCTLLISFYAVASLTERRVAAGAAVALEVGIVLATLQQAPSAAAAGRVYVGLTGLAVAAGVLGVNVRNRRQIVEGLRERAERLEQGREQELALATAAERARIAREMHDVVAHNLSVMVALCDGAAYQVHDAPERAASALEQASRAGRQALGEMRQLLGVLRDAPAPSTSTSTAAGTEAPALAPQPGLRQLGELVDQVRAAGLPVSFASSGHPDRVPAGLELTVYRIVQEALTNTLKHAAPGATAAVTIAWHGQEVTVEVTDTGLSRPGPAPGAGGSGLRGMRERAAVYGGTLAAGPQPQGGWRVATTMRAPAGVAVGVA